MRYLLRTSNPGIASGTTEIYLAVLQGVRNSADVQADHGNPALIASTSTRPIPSASAKAAPELRIGSMICNTSAGCTGFRISIYV